MAAPRAPTVAEARACVLGILKRVAQNNKAEVPDEDAEEWTEDTDPRADFDSVELPGISLENYCKHFIERVDHPQLWPLVLILVDKLCRVADTSFHAYNAHRLVLTAFCIALKISTDYCGVTSVMAKYGGVATQDLISMEVSFLFLLDWRVNIASGVYHHVLQELPNIKAVADRAAGGRGTDMALIPDECLPAALRLQHMARQSIMPSLTAGVGPSVAGERPHATAPLSPELRSRTTASEGVLSAHSFHVTPLSLLPLEDAAMNAAVVLPPPALQEGATEVAQLKPRRVSLAVSLASVPEGSFKGLPVSPRSLGRSRSKGGRFCSMKLRSPRAHSPCASEVPSVLNAQPPAAAVPRPPQQPRGDSGPRPSLVPSVQSAPAPAHPTCRGERRSVGVQSAGAAGLRESTSSTGKRARIEAVHAFISLPENSNNGNPL
eukprot:TRINITY_DN14870_c0_g1_i1.p1 TRINITY_DN14870_c0_g1~~TRINITY_DN14870_c0_g1_i1.p1  ORF type:complete len:435 (+),score=55.75 TRINITY_DN14870_c0_g1_i1:182-1486(+)